MHHAFRQFLPALVRMRKLLGRQVHLLLDLKKYQLRMLHLMVQIASMRILRATSWFVYIVKHIQRTLLSPNERIKHNIDGAYPVLCVLCSCIPCVINFFRNSSKAIIHMYCRSMDLPSSEGFISMNLQLVGAQCEVSSPIKLLIKGAFHGSIFACTF